MCGRYAASADLDELVEEFDLPRSEPSAAPDDLAALEPKYNLAPTDPAPVVLTRRPRGEPDGVPRRQLRVLRWGLVPSWAKDAKGGARMINARSETLLETAAFKRPALTRRCLVPADGWYEWQASPSAVDAKGKPRKQPFYVHRQDGSRLAFAGLYEFWRDTSLPDEHPAAWVVSYTIVTTAAEPGLDLLHERMPVVLDPQQWQEWLDPDQVDPEAVRRLLASPGPGRFAAYPVSTRVNSVRHDGPELLVAAPAADLVGVVDPMTGEVLG